MISRRSLLLASAALPIGVTGCATVGQFIDANLAQVVADVQTVAAGVKAILPQIANLGLSDAVISTVGGIVNDIQQVAQQVAGVATEANAKPLVQQIASYVTALAAALAAVPGLPPIVMTIIAAAQVLVPAIAQALGLVGMQAAKPTMTVDQARTVLAAYGR